MVSLPILEIGTPEGEVLLVLLTKLLVVEVEVVAGASAEEDE